MPEAHTPGMSVGMSEVLGPCRPFGQLLCTECAVLLHRFDNGGGVGYHHLTTTE